MATPVKLIVKVQVPLVTNLEKPTVFVYSEDWSIEFYHVLTPELIQMMAGQPKAFFYARVTDSKFEFHGAAPWQEW